MKLTYNRLKEDNLVSKVEYSMRKKENVGLPLVLEELDVLPLLHSFGARIAIYSYDQQAGLG